MDYPAYLARVWPIGTGVVEGACGHLVKDRMEQARAYAFWRLGKISRSSCLRRRLAWARAWSKDEREIRSWFPSARPFDPAQDRLRAGSAHHERISRGFRERISPVEQAGMRWKLPGAQAVLDLRAVRLNGDWERYWRFHRQQCYIRRYGAAAPAAAPAEIQILEVAA